MKTTLSSQVKRLNLWLQTPFVFFLCIAITIVSSVWLHYVFWPGFELDEDFYSSVTDDPSFPVCPNVRSNVQGIALIEGACLPGQAVVAAMNFSQPVIADEKPSAKLRGACCPLPEDALARDENGAFIYSEPKLEACDPGYVAVGGSTISDCGSKCFMSCAKINDEKYWLGEERQSVFWVTGDDPGGSGDGGAEIMFLRDIPLAYRHAVGSSVYDTLYRDVSNPYGEKFSYYIKDGCVGAPLGSLLVKKVNSTCSGFFFRQLLHKSSGKPVRFVPHCDAIEGMYTNTPKCIVNEAWR